MLIRGEVAMDSWLVVLQWIAAVLMILYPDTMVSAHSLCNERCNPGHPTCGSNGVIYTSQCRIKQLQKCRGINITVASFDKCKDQRQTFLKHTRLRRQVPMTKCLEDRAQAQRLSQGEQSPDVNTHIPLCTTDGEYEKIQCHGQFCWCVDETGRPIQGTSVEGRPNKCRDRGGSKRRGSRKRGRRADCSQNDRSTFNTRLVRLFKEEYERIQTTPSADGPYGITDTLEKRVIEWKFSRLDKDGDNQLKKKEIRSLTRMIKRMVKPKSCARTFVKHCDLDQNKRIARKEWSVCLGVDINNTQTTVTPGETISNPGAGLSPRPRPVEDISRAALWDSKLSQGRDDEEEEEEVEEVLKNCADERKAAQEMHDRDPNGRIFIPECVETGRWAKEQCHTGYCWCVDDSTGKPIPGTSTFRVKPTCLGLKTRMLKGCSEGHKRHLLTALLDQMTNEMVQYANNKSKSSHMEEPNPDHSLEERVVRWKHIMLDSNRNKMVERGELRQLVSQIRNNKQVKKKKYLRKCARNFVQYCDVDSNKRIALNEWIDCMGINDQQPSLPTNPKRKGPNPFSKYLHS